MNSNQRPEPEVREVTIRRAPEGPPVTRTYRVTRHGEGRGRLEAQQTREERGGAGITITEDTMTSELTSHRAKHINHGWKVTWLPGRMLDRNQATTAMVLAERAAQGVGARDPDWPFIESWAAELGLTGAEAVSQIVEESLS